MTTNGVLTPDQQLKVLSLIWGDGEDGWVFLPWIPGNARNKEERRAGWHEGRAYHWPNEADAILAHLNTHQNDDLYFTPNTFMGESRVTQLTGEETCLYADLDEVDPRVEIDPEIRPSIAWESSPGRFQAVWLLSGVYIGASEVGGLNHRLTNMIGADKSGWDTTQLLRVPGRSNFKFDYKDKDDNPAPGELLWVTKKTFKPQYFERILPDIELYGLGIEVDDTEIDSVDRKEAWFRVRMRCSRTVRDYMGVHSFEITEDQDRSEVMWQIERDLADAGCTVAEIVAIVRGTPWNKYAGRNNELNQLKSEAIKALGITIQKSEEEVLETGSSESRPIEPIWLSGLWAESIPRTSWLVNNIWQRGACGFIASEPKSYKSYVGLDMAISVATGQPFLNDSQFGVKQGAVLFLQEEDAPAITMHRIQQIVEEKCPDRFRDGQISFDMSSPSKPPLNHTDLISRLVWTPPVAPIPLALHVRTGFVASDPLWQAWLADFLTEHEFVLTIIDTLGTSIGDVDINDSAKLYVRVLNPLKEISNISSCAIGIVHHNHKNSDGQRRGQAMSGSGAFHAWTESALYLNKQEYVSGKPNEIRVERESKLDGDFKFRVFVDKMFEEKGSEDRGERRLWAPEVRVGWAESTPEGDTERQTLVNERIGQGKSKAGVKIVSCMKEMGGETRVLTTDKIITSYGQQRHSVLRQLGNAEAQGLIVGDDDMGWTVVR